jgi:cellulose synthase/poly-beta-1,6-N-acetylglucosamine synthase-like glycosyltransferase
MLHWINLCLSVLAFLLAVPVVVVCVECLAALLLERRRPQTGSAHSTFLRPPVAVLIPAHNEQAMLGQTLRALLPQLQGDDCVLVVADNCDDMTAEVACEFAVEVIERRDSLPLHRGKAYALEFGIAHLAGKSCRPKIVITIDADCALHPGGVDALAHQVVRTGRPAQALYLLDRPEHCDAAARETVSALAFLIRNHVRPRGLHLLGLPCPLTGSGMAFPLPLLAAAQHGNNSLVEDMQLGIELAIAGSAASFCENARITGKLPDEAEVHFTQRTRWEHGHIHTALTQVPRLFFAGIRQFRLAPLVLALDLCVPPLSLLVLLLAASIGVSAAFALAGASWRPTEFLLANMSMLAVTLTAAWARFGRRTLPLAALLAAPLYILWKLPMYVAFVLHRQKEWICTPRSAAAVTPVSPTAVEPSLSPR